MALKSNGSVVAWGRNGNGQASVPSNAQGGVIAVAAGGFHSLVLKSDGRVVAWGSRYYNEANVPDSAQSGVTAIAASGQHSLALKSNGSVVAWGDNRSGQTNVPASAQSGVVAIAAGDGHSLAIVPAYDAPTDITLSNSSVAENQASGTQIGTFTSTDADAIFAYSLVAGSDNALFAIDGNALRTAASFDFEARSFYYLRVQTNDGKGGTFAKDFVIRVTNLNEETPSLVVTTLSDVEAEDGLNSLREALNFANRDGADSAITFAVTGTIRLTRELPRLVEDGALSIRNAQSGRVTISGDANNSGSNDSGDVPIFAVQAGANVTLSNLVLSGGRQEGSGGGAIVNNGRLTVLGCTLTINVATTNGGAIANEPGATLTVANSTFADNLAPYGGTLFNAGNATLSASTLMSYSTSSAILNQATLALGHTLLNATEGATLSSYGNAVSDAGYNLANDNAGGVLTDPTSRANRGDLKLGALADYGGPTLTIALLNGSPAINSGDPAFDGMGKFDQRGDGFPRVVGERVDIGAFESATRANRAPVVVPSLSPASPTTNQILTVTPNGSDADGDALTYLYKFSVNGTLKQSGAGATFNLAQPGNGDKGDVVSVSVVANDGKTDSTPGAAQVTVANFAPYANYQYIVTPVDQSASGTLTGSDTDGDALTFIKVSDPAHGSLTLSSNGDFTYVPVAGYAGSDSFSFRVNDGTADSATTTIFISVRAPVAPPAITAFSPGFGPVGTLISISVSGIRTIYG